MGVIYLFLAATGILAAAGFIRVARGRIAAHGLPVLAWRWLTGMPHHGGELPEGKFWARPRHHRSLRRVAQTAAALLAAWGLLFHRGPAVIALEAAAAAALALGAVRLELHRRAWKHRKTWVDPAHRVAAPLVGIPVSAPRDWLAIEPDRSRVVAVLPQEYNPDSKQRQRLVETLSGRLGIESPEVRWQLAGPSPRLELARSAPPPAKVGLAEALPAIEGSKPDELVWGLGKKGGWVKTSLSGDSPHLGISMGSGAGKSVTARSLLAQMLHRGAIGLVLDVKMISHQWAQGLPNVVIARRPAEIHAALLWLAKEVNRRNEVALAGADIDGNVNADVGPRIFVIFEEMNQAIEMLRSYWREIRAKDDPARSPALTALDSVSFTGRQVLVHLVYIGQRLSAKTTGADGRENIGVIAMARWKTGTWKMLAADFPMPPVSLTPGRIQVVSDTVREAQGIFTTPREARELAVSGTVGMLPHDMWGAPATAATAPAESADTASDQAMTHVSPRPALMAVSGVTLREAVAAGLLGRLSIAGARTARHRSEDFPKPVGRDGLAELYDPAALAAWAERR